MLPREGGYPLTWLMMILFALFFVACGSSGGGADSDPASYDLSGTWTAQETVTGNCSGEAYPISQTEVFVVTQSGDAISVTTPSNNGHMSGRVSGNKITWDGVMEDGNGDLTMSFSGNVSGNGDQITGSARWTWSDGSYTCSGKTEVLAAKSASPSDNVTGQWDGNWESGENGMSGTFTADIVQQGTVLSGKISVPYIGMEDAELKGTATGDTIVFGDINDEIVFTGTTTSATAASGTFEYTMGVEGNWQAEKRGDTPLSVSWQMNDMGFTFNGQGKIALGDGRDDGIQRIYTGNGQFGGGNGNINEFSYSGGQWEHVSFGDFQSDYGTANLTTINGLAIGAARDDGVNRLYAGGYDGAEFEYGTDLFTGRGIGEDIEWTYDLAIGDGRREGQNSIYLAGTNGILELVFGGNDWTQTVIATDTQISSLLVTDGRNDGILRLYAATEMGNHVYEFTWADGQWQAADCGAIDGVVGIDDMAAGPGRNDGVNRIYLAANGGIFELSFDGNAWQAVQIGTSSYTTAVTIGTGRSTGDYFLYAADEPEALNEYGYTDGWRLTSTLASGQPFQGIVIGDGRNTGINFVYATAADDHVYEFSFP